MFSFAGIVNNANRSYLDILYDLWFMPYSRQKGHLGSSGFEHVFLAELRGEMVLGLHNWVYFAEQEQLENLNYQGYINTMKLEKVCMGNQYYVKHT